MASYTVKSGDSLSAIAKRYNTTVSQLLLLNPKLTDDPRYKDGKVIFSGTKITLPGTESKTATPPPVATTPPSTPTTTTPPATTTPPVLTVPSFSPSALAGAESGAIGAASISAQMTAADEAQRKLNTYGVESLSPQERTLLGLPPLPQPGTIVTPTAEEPIPTINAPAILQSTEATPPPVAEQPTQSQTMPGVFIGTAGIGGENQASDKEVLIDPFTGRIVLDKDGNPVLVKIGGTQKDYLDYLLGARRSQTNLQAAGAANKLAIERATATGEAAKRTAERDIYRSQQRALNELSRRGLSGAPGLTRAAQRAYGAAPLSQRLEAIRKMQSEITGANLLLAQQQAAEKAAEEQRQVDLTKATGIVNQLGGTNG